ncbi:hypothetical protein [Clostridium sp.]|uniref:hypothetical protein n=1 Tax=Clostridium sp. TaxID=1506 RepID=UPI003F323058
MKYNSKIKINNLSLILILIFLSLALYTIHYLLFKNIYATISTVLFSIAFTPLQAVINTQIINKILIQRDKVKKEKKLEMLVENFYSQIGTDLLKLFTNSDSNLSSITVITLDNNCLEDNYFQCLSSALSSYNYSINESDINFDTLYTILNSNINVFMDLLNNPILDEDTSFTDTLNSLVHLKKELEFRYIDSNLDEKEKQHIMKDLNLTYSLLSKEWIKYIDRLSKLYPDIYVKELIYSPFHLKSKSEKDNMYFSYTAKTNL